MELVRLRRVSSTRHGNPPAPPLSRRGLHLLRRPPASFACPCQPASLLLAEDHPRQPDNLLLDQVRREACRHRTCWSLPGRRRPCELRPSPARLACRITTTASCGQPSRSLAQHPKPRRPPLAGPPATPLTRRSLLAFVQFPASRPAAHPPPCPPAPPYHPQPDRR